MSRNNKTVVKQVVLIYLNNIFEKNLKKLVFSFQIDFLDNFKQKRSSLRFQVMKSKLTIFNAWKLLFFQSPRAYITVRSFLYRLIVPSLTVYTLEIFRSRSIDTKFGLKLGNSIRNRNYIEPISASPLEMNANPSRR